MAIALLCDGCECSVKPDTAIRVGRIEPMVLCKRCHHKHAVLQDALEAKRVAMAAEYEAFQRAQREASGLKAVPDA